MESLIEAVVRKVVREEIVSLLANRPFRLSLTLPDAALATGYSLESIRKAIREDELVPSYANSKPVVMVEELERWLRTLPSERC